MNEDVKQELEEERVDIEKIVKDYIEASKKQSTKRLSFFDDVYTKVRRGNRENVEAFRTIEKAYIEEQNQQKALFEQAKSEIDAIEQELKTGLDKFNASYDINAETKKLEDNKEKGILPKQQIYRKELHDINFKLDRILKDEKDTLKAKQDAYDEFEKNYKAKIQDLEKKCRFEINKEKTVTLARYDELQKSLLDTNDRREIKKINKEIQSIQKVGIENEKKIRLNYVDLIKAEDVNYYNQRKALLLEINDLVKDFNTKKQECDTEKKQINLRYQIELDKYDFGSKRAINNLNKKMVAKKNALIVSYKDKELVRANQYKDEDRLLLNKRKSITNDFEKVMDNNYNAFNETIANGSVVISNTYYDGLNNIHEFLNVMINNVFFMVSSLHQEYALNVIDNEYNNIKLFIMAKYNYETLVHKDYKEFSAKLQKLYDDFKLKALENGHNFEVKLDAIYDEAIKSMDHIFDLIKQAWDETDVRMNYHNDLKALLKEGYSETLKYDEEFYTKEYDNYEYVSSLAKDLSDAKDVEVKENEAVNKVHEENDKALDEEISKYNTKQDAEKKSYEDECADKINEINTIHQNKITELENELTEKLALLDTEEIKDKAEIEEDYKTQMSLLK